MQSDSAIIFFVMVYVFVTLPFITLLPAFAMTVTVAVPAFTLSE